jgi:hypothetical protein
MNELMIEDEDIHEARIVKTKDSTFDLQLTIEMCRKTGECSLFFMSREELANAIDMIDSMTEDSDIE